MLDAFADGAYFVALATIRDPAHVLPAIAQALEIKEEGARPLARSVADALRDKRLLLLLDNFEQVVAAASVVAQLMAAARRLKVLVTSRQALHVSGEHEFAVPPLDVPRLQPLPPAGRLPEYAAVALFVQRSQAVAPAFAVADGNRRAVAELCVHLEGLPLAIELAAARSKLYGPEALLRRLARRLAPLTGGPVDVAERHQTLRNAIAWSYNLLEAGEQAALRRLGVFVGGFGLEAAPAVCDPDASLDGQLENMVASLVDKSLLGHDTRAGGEPRFGMLGTIREYALEQLQASGEAEGAGQRHADFYLALVEQAEPELAGPRQATWLTRLRDEHDNLRTALRWLAARGEAEQGLRLAGALGRFWDVQGFLTEGREQLATFLSMKAPEARAAQAKALSAAGMLACRQGAYAEAGARCEASLGLYRELGDKRGVAAALNGLGNVALLQRDHTVARSRYEASLALNRALGDGGKGGAAIALVGLGNLALYQGDYATGRDRFEESLDLFRELGDKRGIAAMLNNLGMVALYRGDFDTARQQHEESLAIRQELRDRSGTAASLMNLGIVAYAQRDYEAARARHEESLAIKRDLGDRWGVAAALGNLGTVDRQEDECEAARARHEASLAIQKDLGDKLGIAYSLNNLGEVDHQEGKYEAARARHEQSLAIKRDLGDRWGIAYSRAKLDEQTFAAAWAAGQTMSLEKVAAYALGQETRSAA